MPAAVGCDAAGAFFNRKSKLHRPAASDGVCVPRTTAPPGLFQVKVIALLAEQYCAVPRMRHSAPPRLNCAESTPRSSGSVVTTTVSVDGCRPAASLTVSWNVSVCPDSFGPDARFVAQLATVCAPAPLVIDWLAPLVNDGASLTGLTVRVKVRDEEKTPSLAVTVTVAVPDRAGEPLSVAAQVVHLQLD